MIASRFWEDFGIIANAPNGVSMLRELVLCLAVQGKIVEQSSADTPANVLLAAVDAEKERLVREQKLKAPKEFLEIRENERAHPIPTAWEWVRFGTIALHNSGKTLDQQRNSGQPRDYITTSNLYWGRFDLRSLRQMLIEDDELDRCTAVKGDLLICEGGEAGRAAVWESDKEVSFQNHVHRARFYAKIDPYYAYRFFQKLNATGEINLYRKGVGISNMSGKALASIVFPLPPLEEQKRIVARVDELMALCDQLEAQQQERERRFPVLSRTCHAHFTEAPTTANLNRIFDETGTISPDDLRKTILELAVRGKLASKEDADEPAHALLEIIDRGRAKLAKEQGVRIPKNIPLLTHDDLPHEVPASWQWARLGHLALAIEYGTSQKAESSSRGVPVYRMGNIVGGRLINENMKYVEPNIDDLPALFLKSDDILFNRTNSHELVGKVGIFKGADNTATFASYLIRIRLPTAMLSPDFVSYALNSPYFRRTQIEPEIVQQCGQANFNGTKLAATVVPIPSLAEQRRIVAKVDQLMALVDKLEAQQQERDKLAEAFAKACVASFTGTTQLERPEKMKAPKTELVSLVTLGNKPKPETKAPLAQLLSQNKGTLPAKSLWQQSGLTIDAFYQQLKTELAQGWIAPPAEAEMKILEEA